MGESVELPKSQKMFLISLLVIPLIISIFFSSLSIVSSENDTLLNSSNITNGTTKLIHLNVLSQQDQTAAITIQVTPQSVDLGNRLADGSEWSYLDQTYVSVTANNLSATDKVDLYVRASDLSSGSSVIDLSNFKYDGFSNSTLSKTHFTEADTKVKTWDNTLTSQTVPVNYYLNVPFNTPSGTYSSTITYTLVVE